MDIIKRHKGMFGSDRNTVSLIVVMTGYSSTLSELVKLHTSNGCILHNNVNIMNMAELCT